MTVVGVAELESQPREVACAGSQAFGGAPRAQSDVGAQAQPGGPVEGARQVKG
jgi:hypothetical protein